MKATSLPDPGVVDPHGVGVVEPGHDPRLAAEPGAGLLIAGDPRDDQLQGPLGVQLAGAGPARRSPCPPRRAAARRCSDRRGPAPARAGPNPRTRSDNPGPRGCPSAGCPSPLRVWGPPGARARVRGRSQARRDDRRVRRGAGRLGRGGLRPGRDGRRGLLRGQSEVRRGTVEEGPGFITIAGSVPSLWHGRSTFEETRGHAGTPRLSSSSISIPAIIGPIAPGFQSRNEKFGSRI